jgi:alpha-L-fucosidase
MNRSIIPVTLLALLTIAAGPATQPGALIVPDALKPKVYSGPSADAHVAAWRAARFGMFLHWGVYSIPGRGEWVMWNEQIPHRDYAKFADQFNPKDWDPHDWVNLAHDAGMKYMVLTSKHHDGFGLFDSKANPFNSVKTAAHRDIVREYTTAAREGGMLVGLYYSPLDWRFPGYFFPDLYAESAEAMRAQYHSDIEQLASDYGKLDILWFDGGGEQWLGFGGIEHGKDGWAQRPKNKPYHGKFSWQDDEATSRLRQLQPGLVMNDRTSSIGDFHSREGVSRLGDFENTEPWELCFTLAGAWGYTPNTKPMALAKLEQALAGAFCRDGNVLLNVGPDPQGKIDPAQADRLRELGKWVTKNAAAIYSTRGGPYLPTDAYGSTRKDNAIYVYLFQPASSVHLPPLRVKIASAEIDGAKLQYSQNESGVQIDAIPASTDLAVLKLTLVGSALDIPLIGAGANP